MHGNIDEVQCCKHECDFFPRPVFAFYIHHQLQISRQTRIIVMTGGNSKMLIAAVIPINSVIAWASQRVSNPLMKTNPQKDRRKSKYCFCVSALCHCTKPNCHVPEYSKRPEQNYQKTRLNVSEFWTRGSICVSPLHISASMTITPDLK